MTWESRLPGAGAHPAVPRLDDPGDPTHPFSGLPFILLYAWCSTSCVTVVGRAALSLGAQMQLSTLVLGIQRTWPHPYLSTELPVDILLGEAPLLPSD